MEVLWILVLTFIVILCEINIYTKYCFKDLNFEINLSRNEVFEGDTLILSETISNKKFLPILWLEVQFLVSKNLKFDNSEASSLDDKYYKKDIYSILPYEKLKRKIKLTALKRGYYTINNATLTVGDIFVIYKYLLHMDYSKDLFVYPKLLNGREFNLKFSNIIGELETKKYLLDDPFMLKGIRDYTPYDSLKTVNWLASARTGDLKVNEFNSSSSREVILLLDTQKYTSWDSEDKIEESIRIVASMSAKCIENNVPISIFSNAINELTQSPINVPIQSGKAQLNLIYRNLACINLSNQKLDFLEMIKNLKLAKKDNSLCIVITHDYSKKLIDELLALKRNKLSINLILVKSESETVDLNPEIKTYIWEVNALGR
ncbi:DUF58 domain-containing protein [Clostridium hydrogenum]|uniref:DUF58 domain-containing protein n=1 Tax=Clostridium hydrogenum TaxID=2855764 RepID=UPI001F3EBDBF|nr:DUF58 domain-containing protein [Clostridium hydrogenum]